ncbi:methylmalonyl Co-A mutase-associated GTPase MeaB [Bacteriovoracaceae bacterium]|nr:methylmalonyl Co-A mutase-associated GTPase MeaB [Bacteriovoracaceae bacterium]
MKINAKDILEGNIRSLAKAITLIESKKNEHKDAASNLLEELTPHSGKSIRIGISGVPGVGKSTFIEAFGLFLISQGHRVSVLAVDPSSPISGGSILGDKTRMEKLSQNENAYIRPTPTDGSLGGVSKRTKEAIILCESAGFDITLVETVGVGQSEYEVSNMVDFFLVLMVPSAGDELQGIKKGIIEISDLLVINKADGDLLNLAKISQQGYENALHIMSKKSEWVTKVLTCSALHSEGMEEIWKSIKEFQDIQKKNKLWDEKRKQQNLKWFESLLTENLLQHIQSNPVLDLELKKTKQNILNHQSFVPIAVKALLSKVFTDS